MNMSFFYQNNMYLKESFVMIIYINKAIVLIIFDKINI